MSIDFTNVPLSANVFISHIPGDVDVAYETADRYGATGDDAGLHSVYWTLREEAKLRDANGFKSLKHVNTLSPESQLMMAVPNNDFMVHDSAYQTGMHHYISLISGYIGEVPPDHPQAPVPVYKWTAVGIAKLTELGMLASLGSPTVGETVYPTVLAGLDADPVSPM